MLDAADHLLAKAFQALIRLDDRAIKAVGLIAGERVFPAVDRAVRRGERQLRRWQAGRRP